MLFSADAVDLLVAPVSSSPSVATPPLISLDEHSAHYRGAVCASWMGSIHRVVDSGLPPTAPAHAAAFPWPAQRELAVVLYAPNVLRHVESKVAQASASWLSGGYFQRQIMPQAAP